MLEYEQYRLELQGLEKNIDDLEFSLDIKGTKEKIAELEEAATAQDFWDDMENSQKILQKTGKLKNTVSAYDTLCSSFEDLEVLIEMGDEEEDLSLVEEIEAGITEFEKGLASLRLQTLLTGEYDKNNAIFLKEFLNDIEYWLKNRHSRIFQRMVL